MKIVLNALVAFVALSGRDALAGDAPLIAGDVSPNFVTYIDSMTSWWPPSSIAAGMALPGYASSTDYNVINLAFW